MASQDLLNQFLSKNNFISAYQRIASKKSKGGIDGVSVEAFGRDLDKNIQKLQKEILQRRYIPQPVSIIYLPKFNEENEWRELGLPTVADKVVQAALLQVVEPLGERIFLNASYGYRPGKGPQKALRRVEHNLRYGKKSWIVQRDIDNFFDTLNHEILLARFSKLVDGDPILVELVSLWCKMGLIQRDGRWRNVQAGVRQGQIISPFLANLYLHPLDEFLEKGGLTWVRYADNILLQCATEEEARSADASMLTFLHSNLCLRVNASPDPIANINQGFTFLGVRFQGEKRAIDAKKMEKIRRKVDWLLSVKNKGTPEKIITDLTEMVEGWRRYYGFLNPVEEFSQLDNMIEKAFNNLLVERLKSQMWGGIPPEGLSFPRLSKDNENYDGTSKLRNLWKQGVGAVRGLNNNISQVVQKKVTKRRSKHRKEHALKGEIVINSPGQFIAKRGERIVVRNKQMIIAELPAIHFKGLSIGCKGVSLSADVVELCMSRQIPIHFMDEKGSI